MFCLVLCNDFSTSCLCNQSIKMKRYSMSEGNNRIDSLMVLAMVLFNK